MYINNPGSPTQIATSVWAAATRKLTGLGTAITTTIGDSRVAVANGTSLSLQPPVGSMEAVTYLGIALANVTWAAQFNNGVNVDTIASAASGSALSSNFFSNNSFWVQINNSGTVSGNFSDNRMRFNI